MANVILDDTLLELSLGGGAWSEVSIERFFGGSAIWPAFALNENAVGTGQFGTFSLSFNGTSISFFGNTPGPKASQNIFVSIDGNEPYESFYDGPSPSTSLQWYQSPVLAEGLHTINVSRIAGTSVDYAVIAAGLNTPLRGTTLIVDDGDPSIVYQGNWTRNSGRYTSSDNPHSGYPYGNATSQSNTVGSKVTFLFSGNNVTVYSLFDWSHLGYVEVTYTLDSVARSIRRNAFIGEFLEWRNHNLTMEITSVSNQTFFVLDYILYTPAFDTLASKPDLSPATSTKSSTSEVSTAGLPTNTSNSTDSKSTPVRAIVGGVVGGFVAICLALVLFLFRKRFFKSMHTVTLSVEPFTGTGSASSWNDTPPDEDINGGILVTSQHKPILQTTPRGISPLVPLRREPSGNQGNNIFGPVGVQHKSTFPTSSPYSLPLVPLRLDTQNVGPVGVQHKPALSTSSPNLPPLVPLRRDTLDNPSSDLAVAVPGPSAAGGILRSRMHRLQDLVTELNREIGERGEESVRVAILRGRIAELTREDATGVGETSRLERRNTAGTMTFPPPYEPHD